jgi:hypothetical protein
MKANRRFAAGALMALLAAAGAAPAAAQQPEPPAEFQSFHMPGWSFTPSVALGTVYDSNVALSAPSGAAGDTQGDTMFNVIPGGQLEYSGRRADFSANYRGFLRRYMDSKGLDGFDQRGSLAFRRTMSRRVTLFVNDYYADSPTTDEVQVNGVPFVRVGSQMNSFAAGADVRLSRFTTLSTRYDAAWVSFDRPETYLAGGWIQGIRGELTRRVSARVTVGGSYGYRTASIDQGARDLSFQDAGGMLHYAFTPRTRGSVEAGLATLHDRTNDENRSGPFVRLGITHQLEYATVGAGYERQYVPSFGFGGATSSQELRGYVQMPLGRRRLYVQGSGAWRRTMPLDTASLQLDTVWVRSTVGFFATRWSRLEGLYTYTLQDSIITGGEVSRHRVGVQLVISQPVRMH